MTRDVIVPFKKGSDSRINIKVNAQRKSLKGLLLLFVEPYTAGTRDSEKYIFPDIKNVSVTINGSPNMLYNNGIEARERGSPLLHERRIQSSTNESAKVLH